MSLGIYEKQVGIILKEYNEKLNNMAHKKSLSKTGFWGEAGAGCVIISAETGKLLLPLRSEMVREPGTWGTWGGAIDKNESPTDAVMRELSEEAGNVSVKKLIKLHTYRHKSGFKYYNFLAIVNKEFKPKINNETSKWGWFDIDNLPSPLHFGLKSIIENDKDIKIIKEYAKKTNESTTPISNKKIIVSEQQFKQLIEKRSHAETNTDITFNQFFNNMLAKTSIDNMYVSFRHTMGDVTDVNKDNSYSTPTGFYTYPLKSFKGEIEELLLTKTFNEDNFRNLFPFNSKLNFIHFFIPNSDVGIISEETSRGVILGYVNKIRDIYNNKMIQSHRDKGGDDWEMYLDVANLCDWFKKNTYIPTYSKVTVLHDAHRLWLLLYDAASILTKAPKNTTTNNMTTMINTICRSVGINGFADYVGYGYIHPNEEMQAVFFKVKNIGNVYVYRKPRVKDLFDFDFERHSDYEVNSYIDGLTTTNRGLLIKLLLNKKRYDDLKRVMDIIGIYSVLNILYELDDYGVFKKLPQFILDEIDRDCKYVASVIKNDLSGILNDRNPILTTDQILAIFNTGVNEGLIGVANHKIYNERRLKIAIFDHISPVPLDSVRNRLPLKLKIIKKAFPDIYNKYMGEYGDMYDNKGRLDMDMVMSIIDGKYNFFVNNFEKVVNG